MRMMRLSRPKELRGKTGDFSRCKHFAPGKYRTPETNSSEFTLENSNGLKDKHFLLGQFRPIFKGELLVSW